MEVKLVQGIDEGEIETVSTDSVHLNKNQSLITAKLEMQAGGNTTEITYKIDTGSEGNIILSFMLRKYSRILQKSNCKINKKPYQAKNIQQN